LDFFNKTFTQEPKEGITKIFQDISTWVQDLVRISLKKSLTGAYSGDGS